MSGLGTLYLDLAARTAPFERALSRAQSRTNSFASSVKRSASSAVGSLNTRLRGLGGAIDGTIAKLGVFGGAAGVGGIAAFSIKAAADLESTKASFETMLGSAEKADAVVRDLADFSKKTPFEPSEVFGAARRLLASDFEADELRSQLTSIGDVAAGVNARIEDLAGIFGEVAAKGRADATDLLQFGRRGIGVKPALAKALGVTTEEITKMTSEGKIGLAELQAAFRVMTSEGGKFAGGMERQSKTMNGLMSTLKGNISAASAEIGTAATEAGNLKGIITDLNSTMESIDTKAIGRGIADSMRTALEWIDKVDAAFTSLRMGLLGLIELATKARALTTSTAQGILESGGASSTPFLSGLTSGLVTGQGGGLRGNIEQSRAVLGSVRGTAAGLAEDRLGRQGRTQDTLKRMSQKQEKAAKTEDINRLNATMQNVNNTLKRIESKTGAAASAPVSPAQDI